MPKIKAFIIGVSDYNLPGVNSVPFCKNDINLIRHAFIEGLKVDPSNIIECGSNGVVTKSEFIQKLSLFGSNSDIDDTLLLFFSGHGSRLLKGGVALVFSDGIIPVQGLINYLEKSKSKNKIIFLNCCHAGDFTINDSAIFNADEIADEFVAKGYAVIASCNAQQSSFEYPNKNYSVFTYFLMESLLSPALIKKGKKSLKDIYDLLFLLLENWNKINPKYRQQTPAFRAKMGGTIFFEIENYIPYLTSSYYEEFEKYIIYSVKPSHNVVAKRYTVQIILKTPMPYNSIAEINHEVVMKVKNLDIYENKRQEILWKNKPANLIFCYFGMSESDIFNHNYLCHTTWVDDTQNKSYWYRLGKNAEVIKDILFVFTPYYQSFRSYIEENNLSEEQFYLDMKKIISRLITFAEQIISYFHEYCNGTIDEIKLKEEISKRSSDISCLVIEESDLKIAPDNLKLWGQCCDDLTGCIDDFILFYDENNFLKRDPDNRKSCMNIAIARYYQKLEEFKKLDKNLKKYSEDDS